jgi:hypothetical protein
MPAAWAAGAAAIGTVAAGYMQSQATQNAAQTQANAALQQQGNLLAAGQTASQQFTPYANYGTTALNNLTGNNAYFNNQFTNADLNSNLAPNYNFMLQQGQNTTNAANNATGGAASGNSLLALQNYGQNYAQNAYQDAFTNYQNQRTNIATINSTQAQLGLAGATGSANAQLGTATNIANIGMQNAQNQAAAQIAQGQIYGGASNTLGSIGYGYAQQQNNQLTNANNNPYANMGIVGNSNTGYTYSPTAEVGPSASLANFNAP